MTKTRRELIIDRPKHTRVCRLCGNTHPMTAQYFMTTDKPNRKGIINGGLLFVCKACQAHWGPTLSEDVNHMGEQIKRYGRFAGIHARSFVDMYGKLDDEPKDEVEDADAA